MSTWLGSFLNTPVGSFVKVALGVFLAALLDYATDASWPEPWGTLAQAVVVAAVPIVINWLNAQDTRYGRGSASEISGE